MPNVVPFDPSKHKPQDIGLGGPSTEYLITVEDENNQVIVVPSIWWDEKGTPQFIGNPETNEIDYDRVMQLVQDYEQETQQMFPRFGDASNTDNYNIADRFAQTRSEKGGASTVPLVNALDPKFSSFK